MSDSDATRMKNAPIRACTNCVRAKVKCSPGARGDCERCTRLNKDCQPSPPVRKRRPRVERNTGKIDKLEERLDGLVVLLQSAVHRSSSSSAGGDAAASGARPVVFPPAAAPIPSPPVTLPEVQAHQQFVPSSSLLEPTISEAELYLSRFRDFIVADLPFLIISPSLTAQQLRSERPLLWLSIMTVASTRPGQQNALSKEVKRVFGYEAYIKGTKSLDFLLAVLVYLAWDRWYVIEKNTSTTLVYLAASIMYELALDKPAYQDAGVLMLHDLKGCRRPTRSQQPPQLDERRLVLGCYLLSTVPSQQGKGESLKWTPYYDQCVRVLEEQKEHPSDLILTHLVKLRQLAGSSIEYLTTTYGSDSTLRPDASLVLKSLQAQLQTLKSKIPPDVLANKTLLLELQNTECAITQLALLPTSSIFLPPGQDFTNIYASMQSIKSWVDTFLTIPPAEYIRFSALAHTNIVRCLVNLYRLATCDHPEWDKSLLHQSINVSWVLEETANRFLQVSEAAGFEVTEGGGEVCESTFDVIGRRIGCMKTAWDELVLAQQTPVNTTTTSEGGGVQELGELPLDFVDFWDWPS
ncbi:hypothetical protein BJY01DRAFT_29115 [Aspergillus pseudoustus]|uniref:Zn(2)-C6 fungal-type domain-containing protein n=1 Tax=Aspergillus pseudoustus TaxID=1810923 RepID=A0ABR4JGW4_9EURO